MKRLLIILFLFAVITPALARDTMVVLNVKTLIYHKPDCAAAKRCTRNCIILPKNDVIKRGATPCGLCGG